MIGRGDGFDGVRGVRASRPVAVRFCGARPTVGGMAPELDDIDLSGEQVDRLTAAKLGPQGEL